MDLTTAGLVVGGLGLVLLLVSVAVHDVLDGLVDGALPDLHGWVSGPGVGGFLAAGGLTVAVLSGLADQGALVAVPVGLAGGLALGALAALLTRAAMRMGTDATPRADDLVGASAVVVTAIRSGGYGQVTLTGGGTPRTLSARAETALERGAAVWVTAAPSSTSVVVAPVDPLP